MIRNELENTPRYKFFEEMKELEMKFFSEHGMTIGNLYKYRKILLEILNQIYQKKLRIYYIKIIKNYLII